MARPARRRTAGPAEPHEASPPVRGPGAPVGAGRPAGRRTRATRALAAARAAATKNGSSRLPRAAIDPISGPATKPTPKAAASRPRSRGRSSGSARSATAAWPTAYDDPDAPSRTRPRNSTHRAPARPVTRLPSEEPTSAATSTGLRPTRSERRPHSGAATIWAAEKTASTAAATAGEAPNSSAYKGRTGSMIPNPTMSRATVTHTTPKPGGRARRRSSEPCGWRVTAAQASGVPEARR